MKCCQCGKEIDVVTANEKDGHSFCEDCFYSNEEGKTKGNKELPTVRKSQKARLSLEINDEKLIAFVKAYCKRKCVSQKDFIEPVLRQFFETEKRELVKLGAEELAEQLMLMM